MGIDEMPEDIPAYLQEHLESCAAQFKKHITLTDEAIEYLCHYPCPNNLRDIYNFAVRATMLATGPVVDLAFVLEKLLPDMEGTVTANEMHIVADREELSIRRVLRETNNNRNLAAEKLGISRSRTSGISTLLMALTSSEPMPGITKTFSTNTEPPIIPPKRRPIRVMTGSRALRSAWT